MNRRSTLTSILALTLVGTLGFSVQPVLAQTSPVTPTAAPAEPRAIPLNTGGVEGQTSPETWFNQWGDIFTRNVTVATVTQFLPEPGTGNGAAVVVAPGGGLRWLSMGNEGWEVAQALADRGVAAFVLKYRLQPTPADLSVFERNINGMFAEGERPPPRPTVSALSARPDEPFANPVADAEAAFALIRSRASEWGVDPMRIGMVGFSAGAGTTLATTLAGGAARPAFIAPIYGAMDAVEVPADAPPMFVALAIDDPLFGGRGIGLVQAWHQAGRPVELHLYQNGGHGFGLGNPGKTSLGWFDVFMRWLELNGFLQAAD